jgi:asparagine synthase (glutamine-hydrolysing)
MCGIAGIFHFDKDRKADSKIIKSMTDSLVHRGPDGEGFYIHENLALGHRRLSIIDLETGDQPMFSEDRSIVVIFNGEIYNYIELREELKILGHTFRTSSDTEVIIKAYQEWGLDCQNKFNGMWAFAVWDEKRQHLFLSRDRIGEKPLFYSIFENTLIFG